MHRDTVYVTVNGQVFDKTEDCDTQAERRADRKTEQEKNEVDEGENGAKVVPFKAVRAFDTEEVFNFCFHFDLPLSLLYLYYIIIFFICQHRILDVIRLNHS